MTWNPDKTLSRTPEQIKEHYEIEKELAARLCNASAEEQRDNDCANDTEIEQ